MARTNNRTTTTNMPKWVREDVLPRMGRRTRAVRLLERGTVRKSAVIHTDRNTFVAEKGPFMGVRIYDIGALTPVKACPNCEYRFDSSYFLVRSGETKAHKITGDENPVSDLKDVSPALRRMLKKQGIETTHDILRSDPTTIASMTDVPRTRVQDWFILSDLIRVRGVGPRFAELLYGVGVEGVEDLAMQDGKVLWGKVSRRGSRRQMRGARLTQNTINRWIRSAKDLSRAERTRRTR